MMSLNKLKCVVNGDESLASKMVKAFEAVGLVGSRIETKLEHISHYIIVGWYPNWRTESDVKSQIEQSFKDMQ